jgi:tRNA pseudouridine38-40 synthase
MRFFLEIAYKGTHYHGWQIQPNAVSIQEKIQDALALIFKKSIAIMGAGRTDTGVHAKQLFAHFDTENSFNIAEVLYKLNGILPKDIAIIAIHKVTDDAHARFDALSRTYHYYINTKKNPFTTASSWFVKHDLDLDLMNQAAQKLFDYTDFQCFSKSNTDVKTYLCDIQEAYWKQDGDLLVFTITANRFLRNMVRAIVGTLVAVGSGKLPLSAMDEIIQSKNRSQAGASAAAKGLFLTQVKYPYL